MYYGWLDDQVGFKPIYGAIELPWCQAFFEGEMPSFPDALIRLRDQTRNSKNASQP